MDEFDLFHDDDEELPKRNPVYSVAVGGVLDLDADDLGYPQHVGLWERLRADKRPVPERGLRCPDCYRSRPEAPEWMYIYEKRNGMKIAAHFNRGHRAHEGEGPEHLAYKERIARAAELGGFKAEMELSSTDRKLRSDVRVTGAGGIQYGFEPQISWGSEPDIRKRDRTRREHGITPVWHIVDPKAPLIDHVMWTRTDNLPAMAIRNSRDLLVRGGVRKLNLEKCDHRNPLPCPVKKIGRCGLWHPDWEPLPWQLDDLVRGIAGADFVAVVEKEGARARRFWASAADRKKYVENGGRLLPDGGADSESMTAEPEVASQRLREAECTKDRRGTFTPTSIPPRDSGASFRPAVTISDPNLAAAPQTPRPRRYSDLAIHEVAVLAKEFGCPPVEVGPCGRCYGPTKRYGERARVLCASCRPAG